MAYQVDATHDGDQPNETLPTDLVAKWSDNFGNSVSYPLVVDNRVFVTVSGDGEGGYGSELYALDASDGDVLWGPIELGGTYWRAGIAYDNGRVFAVNSGGHLAAFDAATGDEDWTIALPTQYAFSSPPTASGGLVYVGGAGLGGTLYAVGETSGELLWTSSVSNGDQSAPAVSDTGVYVSYACEQTYDFAPTTGAMIWHHATDCEGGGGRTPVLYDGNLYVRDDEGMSPGVLSASTGAQLGTFSSTTAPAFDNGLEFTMKNAVLTASAVSTGTVAWTQTADGSLDSAPIVVGGNVYVAGSSGLVASFNESTGAETWSANAGSPIVGPDENNGSDELTGLGAGDDLLVVPASDTLVAFGAPTSPGAPIIGTATPGDESATVSFTGPASDGGSPVTDFTVTASDLTNPADGDQTVSGPSSPLTVSGLTGDSYSFTVTATNVAGTGPPSSPSNAMNPVVPSPPVTPTPPTPPPTPTPTPTPTPQAQHGYWLVGSDGGIFTFGSARFYGSTGAMTLQRPVVGITPTGNDAGYWLVASDGGIFAFGNARFYGSIPGLGLEPAGSTGPKRLNAPIVGMVPTADGGGYFMVASDGGVFTFGDAKFEGSCPGIGGCSGVAVAVVPDASGNGYWVVTATGHVYAFGDAVYRGAPGPQSVPVTSAVRTTDGGGYWILFSNGVVDAYGDAVNMGGPVGSVGGSDPATTTFTTSDGGGYWVASTDGQVFPYGDAPNDGGMFGVHLNGSIIAATGW